MKPPFPFPFKCGLCDSIGLFFSTRSFISLAHRNQNAGCYATSLVTAIAAVPRLALLFDKHLATCIGHRDCLVCAVAVALNQLVRALSHVFSDPDFF